LGDADLLRLTVTEAASRFQIEAPLMRRDRKSGTKKRKQHEIEEALQLELRASA
jgi:DNA (cytosine-5)-methyltransferase 1